MYFGIFGEIIAVAWLIVGIVLFVLFLKKSINYITGALVLALWALITCYVLDLNYTHFLF